MSEIDTKPDWESGVQAEEHRLGIAGAITRFFINSPLSPLLYIAMLGLGILGLLITPRQEDPQISVPMIDLFVQYPGADVDQVVALAVQPLERLMYEIDGVKHVYSAAERGRGVVTVQFEVGEEMAPSLVKVNDKLASNHDRIPPGVLPPLVKAKGIDDVPVVTITLWSEKDYNQDGVPDVDDSQLRRLAQSVLQRLNEIHETGTSFVVGGRAEQVIVEVYPERLAGFGLSLGQVAQAIQAANMEQQMGDVEAGGSRLLVVSGAFLKTVDDIRELQVGVHNGVPVYVHDVADVRQRPEDAKQLVAFYSGAASGDLNRAVAVPAVTIAVAKKKGTNGVKVANEVIARVNSLKGTLIPNDVNVTITRNYGKTANDKVNALIKKLFIATAIVFVLVWLAFKALKPAIVVLLVIPVVLLFTILCAWLLGFTIDRVSLFALIFSIGILVDDAIVVVENIYRRWLEAGTTDMATAVDAVREVGNPTILATGTVIGALLPMGFVSGMMGPYMLPIPVLGSVAMAISLFAAFVFTPWLAIHGRLRPTMDYLKKAEKREHKEAEWLDGLFRRILIPMIRSPRRARLFKLGMWGAFLLACSLFYFKWVAVKMLPLDNKPEFSVVLNMPEGTALAVTGNMAHRIADRLRRMPEVVDAQIYVGTARPFDFNGMVRHYYLRNQPWQAEIQLELLDKHERERSSHEIAVDAREQVRELIEGSGATFAVVEMPPGPPVLQSVVAEVHGPDGETRRAVATMLTDIFRQTDNLVDVDNYMREPYDYWHFEIDYEKAQRRGITVETINRELAMALGGYVLGDVKQRAGHEPINIIIQIPLAERSNVSRLGDILVAAPDGKTVPLRELGHFVRKVESHIAYHKDLRPVEYVVADVGGKLAAPIYGMFEVQDKLQELGCETPDGVSLCDRIYWTGPPPTDEHSAFEWAGEWTVTYETFRDMGLAFIAALGLIYILVVWEFGNFRIPALIMAPIPLTLLGIIPAHMLFFQMGWGGEFTATSMIGWIALAGIIVRNSILLVDFSVHRLHAGVGVVEAVISACKTRTRPILITALALVGGSSVIFFDPIFQGMAISLASGVLVSTILTLIVIPLGCVKAADALCEVANVDCAAQGLLPGQTHPAEEEPATGTPLWVRLWGALMTALLAMTGMITSAWRWIAERRTREATSAPVASNEDGRVPVSAGSPVAEQPGTTAPAADTSTAEAQPKSGVEETAREGASPVQRSATERPAEEMNRASMGEAVDALTSSVEPATVQETGEASDGDAGQAMEQVTVRRTATRKKAAKKATRKKAVAKKAGARKKAAAKKTVKKAASKKVTVEKQGGEASSASPQSVGKEGKTENGRTRRGIRLKAPDNLSDDGLG